MEKWYFKMSWGIPYLRKKSWSDLGFEPWFFSYRPKGGGLIRGDSLKNGIFEK